MTAATSLSGATTPAKLHLKVLSNSAIACYRACPRKFKYSYKMKRRPWRAAEALRFGTLWHCGLNTWWITVGDAGDKFSAAIHAMRAHAEKKGDDVDAFDLVKVEELMLGYSARWGDELYQTVAVERQFDVALVNPETGAASKTYRVQGALDALAMRDGGKLVHVEHKTTSDDISPGTDYWRMVSALDSQVSTYQSALKSLGLEAETLYDVVRKVDLKPFKETPEELRRYTKGKTKKCPFCTKKGCPPGIHRVSSADEPELLCDGNGTVVVELPRLDARQHEHDETPEEFRLRIREHIAANPERYFARGPIVRLERDEAEHARDTWQTAAMIRLSENAGSFPRNPGGCRRFHRLCEYFEVCSGNASIDDDTRFRTAETEHEELVKEV